MVCKRCGRLRDLCCQGALGAGTTVGCGGPAGFTICTKGGGPDQAHGCASCGGSGERMCIDSNADFLADPQRGRCRSGTPVDGQCP
jgi:hypothetical protein